ncbi:hypothetical protein DLM76_01925 [Leptospira yasudae]|uniref:DUF2268 domain-containing protein n=1 Tax=Leptospira yasudae TaxID=2202201 RepID=A0ABX9M1R1_9LEPT|nr:hypothetical protein [Leptospira yasudae]RHX79444.1 hypothetical protein DLM77_11085 [Leptospira yasudae]RHX95760.1 hypothetical protein DLM76_01925 [Leptospira yasudae]TGK29568.1 hypothetical protein EHQ05_00950 [Leptospira yasudae]TGM07806.1 hypothetical protein EHQ86_07065 [Leptospira yasudae]
MKSSADRNTKKPNILKKIILFLFFIFAFAPNVLAEELTPEQERQIKTVHRILDDLEALVLKKSNPEKDDVQVLVQETLIKLRMGALRVGIREDLERDIFGSAAFSIRSKEDPDPSIYLSPYILDLYQTHPSIVLSAFVHECQHSKSYFDDPERFISLSTTSALEKYLYELDSYNRESQFILKYLKKNPKYKLTPFEALLSTSFEKDNLGYFSYAALGHDMSLAGYLYNVSNFKLTYEEKIQLISKTLEQILAEPINDKAEAWEQYKQVVPMYSFLQFAPQAIRNVDTFHDKIADQSKYDLPKQHPDLYARLLALEKVFADNIGKYRYLQKTLDKLKQID